MKPGKHFVVVLTYCILLAGQSITANAESTDTDIKAAIVQVFTDSVARDHINPWQVSTVEHTSGSGVIIDGHRILTAAHVIENGIAIYVRKVGSDKRYRATATYISDATELAILAVEDDAFFQGVSNLPLGVLPELGDPVTVWGFPEGGNQIAITKGIVSRIDFDTYAHSGFDNLVCQVDAAINSGASGGAAVVDGRLAGISFQTLGKSDADNVGYIIPVPVINQFLDDIKDGAVHGVPAIAIKVQEMKNPQLREFYGMAPGMGGVLVVESPGGNQDPGNAIKVGDILLGVDGVLIGNDGTAPFHSGDRIDFRYFVTRHQIGDTIPIRLLRDGDEVVIDVELNHRLQDIMLVTRNYAGFVPDYEIVGGLVFQELNEDYIFNAFDESYRLGWMELAFENYKSKRGDTKEKAVFISSVLSDEINIDYDGFEDRRIARVNQTKIDNLDDLRRALAENKAQFHVFEFDEPYGQIVLNRQLVKEREPIIRERYKLGKK